MASHGKSTEQTAVNHSLERYLGNTIRGYVSSSSKATIAEVAEQNRIIPWGSGENA